MIMIIIIVIIISIFVCRTLVPVFLLQVGLETDVDPTAYDRLISCVAGTFPSLYDNMNAKNACFIVNFVINIHNLILIFRM